MEDPLEVILRELSDSPTLLSDEGTNIEYTPSNGYFPSAARRNLIGNPAAPTPICAPEIKPIQALSAFPSEIHRQSMPIGDAALPSPTNSSRSSISSNDSDVVCPDAVDMRRMYGDKLTVTELEGLFSSRLSRDQRTKNILQLPVGGDGAYHCPYQKCNSRHSRRYNLKTHYGEVHEGMKPFSCLWCGEEFARKYDCERHRINAHSNEEAGLPENLRAALRSGRNKRHCRHNDITRMNPTRDGSRRSRRIP
ncbi:hypothetical protein HDU85_007522 [Gaertneriomyces sp. JEL0708]|nr:hypothetical protein HDU85_007522 [Gaertneriomyces sp. JEL0708]